MKARREVLGDEHVDRAIAKTTPFTADFQDLITRYAWGEIWSRAGLDRRMRSAITLTALIALGRHEELALHVRARAQERADRRRDQRGPAAKSAIYCGVPAANSAFAIAQRVLDERDVTRAVVLSAVRTPVGRYGGGLSGVRPDDLAALAIARARSSGPAWPPGEIEDVWFGCANQAGEDNRNVARMAALLAGLPESVAGVTVNRLCASGLAAVVGACQRCAGDGDLFVAGGVESMTRAPFVMAKPDKAFPRGDRRLYDTTLGWRFPNPRSKRCSRSSRWARPERTSPSSGTSRARSRTRSRSSRSSAGRRRTRRVASPTS